ncbi:MAG: DUF411 domain-containing protein [Pseudomonadota bacterium]
MNEMRIVRTMLLFGLMALTACVSAESVWDKETEALSEPLEITVYRSPTCNCCGKWIKHMKKHQFKVTDILSNDMNAVKAKLGVPPRLASCHTAVINGYVIEGHVPAADVKTLIKNKPDVVGLSVPGMPGGTPGMEMGGRKDPFDMVSFDKDGKQRKFNEYSFY